MVGGVDKDVHVEDAVEGQVGHQHTEADGQQQQRLKLLDDGQIQQHAGHCQHDGVLPAALGEEDLCPAGLCKNLCNVGKNSTHFRTSLHKGRRVLTHAGVAPGTAAGTGGRLGNALDAANDGIAAADRGHGSGDRGDDLAGNGAVVSLGRRGGGLGGRGRSSLGRGGLRRGRLAVLLIVDVVEDLAFQRDDEAQGHQHRENQCDAGQHNGTVTGFKGKKS